MDLPYLEGEAEDVEERDDLELFEGLDARTEHAPLDAEAEIEDDGALIVTSTVVDCPTNLSGLTIWISGPGRRPA